MRIFMCIYRFLCAFYRILTVLDIKCGFLRVFFHFFVEIFAVPPVGQDRLRSVKIDRAFKPLKRQILMVFLLFFIEFEFKI